MKKTVRTILICLILVLTVFLAGCEEKPQDATSTLRLALTSSHYKSARSLTPELELMEIDSFHISGTGPKGQTFSIDSDQQLVAIGNLSIGSWYIEAEALNLKGETLVRGTLTTLLSKVTSSATLNLDTLVGFGSVDATVTWDPDQVADDVYLEVTLLDQRGSTIEYTVPPLQTETGFVVLNKELESGSYLLQLRLFSQDVVVSGATLAVRIVNGETSTDTIEMIIGDLSTTFEILLINDTMLPIEGSISASPVAPKRGDEVTLLYTPTNLPQDIDEKDLDINWYCEGSLVQSQSNSFTSIPEAGTHRYDVIVNHEKLGSLGSTTLLLSMSL